MAGLDPAIHVFGSTWNASLKGVDARDEPGHDGLDQPAFRLNHLNADKLIYLNKLEHLVRVRPNAGCSRVDMRAWRKTRFA